MEKEDLLPPSCTFLFLGIINSGQKLQRSVLWSLALVAILLFSVGMILPTLAEKCLGLLSRSEISQQTHKASLPI